MFPSKLTWLAAHVPLKGKPVAAFINPPGRRPS